MTAVAASTPWLTAEADPSRPAVRPLAFTLDLSCPVSLPSRPLTEHAWPFSVAGPSTGSWEASEGFLRRRYLESLYLSDTLYPLADFASDLARVAYDSTARSGPVSIAEILLSLPQIEVRHRKEIAPILLALSTATYGSESGRDGAASEAVAASSLTEKEIEILRIAIALRSSSHAAVEGHHVLRAKKLSEEFERRETLMQIILLFVYLQDSRTVPGSAVHQPELKKRKRKRSDRDKDDITPPNPTQDPQAAMELLMDRLSVWHAVAELGIGGEIAPGTKGKTREDEGMQAVLKRFWEELVVQFYLPKQVELCSTFHAKVFGRPIPPDLLPPQTTKKPRKPKYTRARPSTDDLVPEPLSLKPKLKPAIRSSSRAPSETSTAARCSPPPLPPREVSIGMQRSTSRTSDTLVNPRETERSRSHSLDKSKDVGIVGGISGATGGVAVKRPLVRAPSGKDLFKGREVGLMRRTTSFAARKEKELAREESQLKLGGLLGRKTSDPKRRDSDESQKRAESQKDSQTLIFATPSKPKLGAFFRPSKSFQQPTPISEEPSSSERASCVAETPVHPLRVAETPSNPHRYATVAPLPLSGLASVDEDEDDPLGDLMVMTDEEMSDGEQEDALEWRHAAIPETPAR